MIQQSVRFQSCGDSMAGQLFLPESSNSTPTLIICHGASEFKENYFDLCAFLAARGITAFAMDMHGHGESAGPRYHVEMRSWIADIRAAIDVLAKYPQIDQKRICAFGLSSGGTAILEAALVEPRLKALIVLDPTVRNSLPLHFNLILRLLLMVGRVKQLLTGRGVRIPLAQMAKGMHFAADPEINQQILSRIEKLKPYLPLPGGDQSFFVDTIKRVGDIKIPVLIIWGERDEVDPVKTGQLLYEALTCTKSLEIVSGNGHAGHLDRHREKVFMLTAAWILQFLSA
ncbi:MAG: alpha/beta fold hydrolase [Verrucomicrobiota bacterium]